MPTMPRILTVFPLLVLITLSFLALFVEGTAAPAQDAVLRHSRHFTPKFSFAARQENNATGDDPSSGNPSGSSASGKTSSTSSSSSSSSSVASTSSTSSSSASSALDTSVSSSVDVTSSSSIVSTSVIASTSSTLASSSTSSTTSSTPTSTFSSTSTSSKTTSSSTISSSSITSSSKTILQVTSASVSAATSLVVATNIQGAITSTSSPATSAAHTSAEALSSETASTDGFLSNPGAMAGTFTVLGLIVVGSICAVFFILRKRRRSKELDIFDTEYKEYSARNDDGASFGGNGNFFASDMSSLSANAVTHAGANAVEPDYGHTDYGVGMPPSMGVESNRTSVASNHAGYGAFRSATEQRKPPMQGSGLRSEVAYGDEEAYGEAAVDEDQSIYIVPNNNTHYHAGASRTQGMGY